MRSSFYVKTKNRSHSPRIIHVFLSPRGEDNFKMANVSGIAAIIGFNNCINQGLDYATEN